MKYSVIVTDALDNVATAIQNLAQGDTIQLDPANKNSVIKLEETVPQGFKIALQNIRRGESIIKYGEVIGLATTPIKQGQCVHIHNVEGLKGRGDKL